MLFFIYLISVSKDDVIMTYKRRILTTVLVLPTLLVVPMIFFKSNEPCSISYTAYNCACLGS